MSQDVTRRERRWRMRLLVWSAILLLTAVFIAGNFNTVQVRMFVVETEIRLAWALLLAAALGFGVGLLVPYVRRR